MTGATPCARVEMPQSHPVTRRMKMLPSAAECADAHSSRVPLLFYAHASRNAKCTMREQNVEGNWSLTDSNHALTGKLLVSIYSGVSDVRSRPTVHAPHEGETGGHDSVSAPQEVLAVEMGK